MVLFDIYLIPQTTVLKKQELKVSYLVELVVKQLLEFLYQIIYP